MYHRKYRKQKIVKRKKKTKTEIIENNKEIYEKC